MSGAAGDRVVKVRGDKEHPLLTDIRKVDPITGMARYSGLAASVHPPVEQAATDS